MARLFLIGAQSTNFSSLKLKIAATKAVKVWHDLSQMNHFHRFLWCSLFLWLHAGFTDGFESVIRMSLIAQLLMALLLSDLLGDGLRRLLLFHWLDVLSLATLTKAREPDILNLSEIWNDSTERTIIMDQFLESGHLFLTDDNTFTNVNEISSEPCPVVDTVGCWRGTIYLPTVKRLQ